MSTCQAFTVYKYSFVSTNDRNHKRGGRFTFAVLFLLQVHGVVNDTIAFVKKVISTELNSATDNPVSYGNCALIGY